MQDTNLSYYSILIVNWRARYASSYIWHFLNEHNLLFFSFLFCHPFQRSPLLCLNTFWRPSPKEIWLAWLFFLHDSDSYIFVCMQQYWGGSLHHLQHALYFKMHKDRTDWNLETEAYIDPWMETLVWVKYWHHQLTYSYHVLTPVPIIFMKSLRLESP